MGDHIQKIKIACQSDWAQTGQTVDGVSLRDWRITLVAVDDGKEVPGKLQAMLDHVEYILHPTFANSRRKFKDEPYVLKEQGWGEFDLRIVLQFMDALFPPEVIIFDLNFKQANYYEIHTITFTDVSVEAAVFLDSLKTISKESQMSQKKIPVIQDADDQGGTSRASSSLSPPVLSPRSDGLTPHQPFNEISPLSDAPDLDMMADESQYDDHPGSAHIEDEVFSANDLKKINAIHYQQHDSDTCQAWDVPDHFNMGELTRRLTQLSLAQAQQLETLIRKHKSQSMTIDDQDGELVLDLYSLGSNLLSQIWDFTEKLIGK